MKLKHNKKRNTAFLFEVLVRELTKSVIQKRSDYGIKISKIVKEHFGKGTLLKKELEIYKSLQENSGLEPYIAEKLIYEAKGQYGQLDKERIFQEQSALIKKINKELTPDVFSQFVPNYKSIATLHQIFNDSLSPKKKVLLEATILEALTSTEQLTEGKNKKVDSLVIKKFVERYNKQYESSDLHEEQKKLLQKYVMSFSDNGLDLNIYLNEELGRLKNVLSESGDVKEISEDTEMLEKSKTVLSILESFKEQPVSVDMIKKVLRVQNLAREIQD
tara:strand:+ start:116 stop:940 length:825 start_codon:yes stop_codon:yes gene_type:complete